MTLEVMVLADGVDNAFRFGALHNPIYDAGLNRPESRSDLDVFLVDFFGFAGRRCNLVTSSFDWVSRHDAT